MLDRASDRMNIAVIAAMILLVVFHHPFSWLLLAAIISGGIDVLYPHVKRIVVCPTERRYLRRLGPLSR
jgi:hypothetical protein